jgi:site-specific DNA recombinase
MRVLGAGRLSHDTDSTTSPERQTEVIELTVKVRGDRLVAPVVMDLDVSGSISVFKRPELGPWLTDPAKIAQWDVLMIPKVDRLTRSMADFVKIVEWLEEHGKILVSVAESIDLGTAVGRMLANIIVSFAQFERERSGERRREAAEKMRQIGQWNGGRPPYGYMLKDGEMFLRQNPDTAPVVRRIVAWLIDGVPMSVVCQRLTDDGVPTPRGAPVWKVTALKKIVKSRYLCGELLYQGHTVMKDGLPVLFTEEPLITESEWELLADALRSKARPRGAYQHSDQFHMMVRIAYCGECDSPMYHQHNGQNDYYRCHGKHGVPAIRAKVLEAMTEDALLREYGADQIQRRASTGKDYAAEIGLAEHELAELEDQYMGHNLSAERFARMSTRMETRLAELRVLEASSTAPQWEPTGETVAERWQRSDRTERHAMLMRLGLRWLFVREYRIADRSWRWRAEADWLDSADAHECLVRAA